MSPSFTPTQDAADHDIANGRGLRGWCFDPGTNREAGRFIAQRLGKQPFLDGPNGLFSKAEGERAIEGLVSDNPVVGLAFAALTGAPAVALSSHSLPEGDSVIVELTTLDSNGDIKELICIDRLVTERDVDCRSDLIIKTNEDLIINGCQLINRATELFPRLRFGSKAKDQIAALSGNETVFHQLIRHLRALNKGAVLWRTGEQYSPGSAISWSSESPSTLNHRVYGPQRDFPAPDGLEQFRWSYHTKLSGGNSARLYFHAIRFDQEPLVLIGYFGDHLPTIKYND